MDANPTTTAKPCDQCGSAAAVVRKDHQHFAASQGGNHFIDAVLHTIPILFLIFASHPRATTKTSWTCQHCHHDFA